MIQKELIILLVILILFGGAKIPQLMAGLGQGLKEFKKATRDDEEDTKGAATAPRETDSTVKPS